MIKKINNEINDFTSAIKEVKGCDDMLNYINSNIYASIKLLMFASKTFSTYARVLLFFIISLTGLLTLSSISTGGVNTGLLAINIALFALILFFIMQCKSYLILSIKNKRTSMEESKKESMK